MRPGTVPDRPWSPVRHEGEAGLFVRWQSARDEAAREVLIERHLSLARKLAARYVRTREPFDDLFQVACLGLVKAIDRFDPARGLAFSSYAVPTILGELKRHFRDKGYPVHLPRGLQELALKVQEADTVLGARTGSSPSVIEVAEYLSIDSEQVIEALDAIAAHHAASLDEPVAPEFAEDAGTRHDLVGGEEEGYGLVETALSLAAAGRQLPAQDRQVLALRFQADLKQREIAERVGVSQMQVSRILRRATDQLADQLNATPATGNRTRRSHSSAATTATRSRYPRLPAQTR
jgi:RNA polymerase sigma-B factor